MARSCSRRIYKNEDNADDGIIEFMENSENERLSDVAGFEIMLANRPVLMPRALRIVSTPAEVPFLRVFSWNTLAQALAENVDNFPRDDRTLKWPERRMYILQEITQYSPDVVCLQEVDHFRFLEAALQTSGYVGKFFPKPDSPCLHVQGNNGPDGVALFYNSKKLEVLSWDTRVLEIWGYQTNQVVLGALLKVLSNNLEVFFVVTHLKARSSPCMARYRQLQGLDLLQWVDRQSRGRSVFLCGDFNAEPREAVYNSIINHPMHLRSAYRIDNKEPEFTTWKIRRSGEEKKTVDYIFHSSNFRPTQILDMPHAAYVVPKRFPNETYPSDHLSLLADFELDFTNTLNVAHSS